MYTETTLYLPKDVMLLLEIASCRTRRPVTKIVRMLLRRMADEHQERRVHAVPVQYQPDDPQRQWHRLHISLEEDEYEQVTDMRKFYKQSVSKIVTDAVRLYLPFLVRALLHKKITDSYRCRNHAVAVRSHGQAVCWITLWGVQFPAGDTRSSVLGRILDTGFHYRLV